MKLNLDIILLILLVIISLMGNYQICPGIVQENNRRKIFKQDIEG
jgi:hypothetical protein